MEQRVPCGYPLFGEIPDVGAVGVVFLKESAKCLSHCGNILIVHRL